LPGPRASVLTAPPQPARSIQSYPRGGVQTKDIASEDPDGVSWAMTVTSPSLTASDEILVRLAMDDKDIETAGMAGEFAASKVFDRAGVAWIDLGQSPDHHSTSLKLLAAHRPDYLVLHGGGSLLIDVKTYTPRRQAGDAHRFGVTDIEWAALKATQDIGGVPVALLFWNRRAPGRFSYVICLLDELQVPHADDAGSWRCRDFAADEFSTIRLAAA